MKLLRMVKDVLWMVVGEDGDEGGGEKGGLNDLF